MSTTNNDKATTPKKVNIFAKAKGKVAEIETKSGKKETIWAISPQIVNDPPTRDQLNQAVAQVHVLHAEKKTLETREKIVKDLLKTYASERYSEAMAKLGVEPPSPLKVANDKGQTVTFVVQDRGHLTKVGDNQYEALSDLIGADNMPKIVWEGGDFKFNADIMAQPAGGPNISADTSVQDLVAEAISTALAGLVEEGKLSQEQVDELLVYEAERRFRPQALVGRAVEVCGKNPTKLAAYFDLAGSGITRYVKA